MARVSSSFFFEIVERRGYRGYGAPNAIFRIAALKKQMRPEGLSSEGLVLAAKMVWNMRSPAILCCKANRRSSTQPGTRGTPCRNQ
jgi:hypothetical protein